MHVIMNLDYVHRQPVVRMFALCHREQSVHSTGTTANNIVSTLQVVNSAGGISYVSSSQIELNGLVEKI